MTKIQILGAVALFAGLVQGAGASIITNGTFSISGTIYVTGPGPVAVTGTTFNCAGPAACIFFQDTSNPANNNVVDVLPVSLPSGSGPGLIPTNIAGPLNPIASLDSTTEPVGNFAQQFFLSFNPATGITTKLFINRIEPGFETGSCAASPAAAGQTCTPPGSFINFQNNSDHSSVATFTFDGTTDSGSTWTGIFTAPFINQNFQTTLSDLANKGFATDGFTAQITLSTTPEPGSVLMIGTGLIGLAAFLRRRAAK